MFLKKEYIEEWEYGNLRNILLFKKKEILNKCYKEWSIHMCTDMEWSPKGIWLNEKKKSKLQNSMCSANRFLLLFKISISTEKEKELGNHAPKLIVDISQGRFKSNLII